MSKGKFVGAYVEDMKLVMTAAAVSNLHATFLGRPGCGKTQIARAVAREIWGDNGHVFIRLSPTSPPEVLRGTVNPEKLLGSPSRLEYDVKGTAYDPDAECIILDEWSRSSDAILDNLLDVLDRQDIQQDVAPVVFGTSNFLPLNERNLAVLDRFSFYYWVKDAPLPLKDIVNAHLQSIGDELSVGDGLPTPSEIKEVQNMRNTKDAKKGILDLLTDLESEARKGVNLSDGTVKRFETANYRRRGQWAKMLFRTSAYFYGSESFTEPHEKAIRALAWCQVLKTPQEASDWAELCGVIVDPVTAVIDQIMSETYAKMAEVNKTHANDRVTAAAELGAFIGDGLRRVSELPGVELGSERYEEVSRALHHAMVNLVKGRDMYAEETK